jgi:hypothetical protein
MVFFLPAAVLLCFGRFIHGNPESAAGKQHDWLV